MDFTFSAFGGPSKLEIRTLLNKGLVHTIVWSRKKNFNTEHDRAKVPPYNGNDPRPPLVVYNQGAAKGGRQKEFDHFFVFGTLLVTFRSLFLTLLSPFSSLFCQTPFAGLL